MTSLVLTKTFWFSRFFDRRPSSISEKIGHNKHTACVVIAKKKRSKTKTKSLSDSPSPQLNCNQKKKTFATKTTTTSNNSKKKTNYSPADGPTLLSIVVRVGAMCTVFFNDVYGCKCILNKNIFAYLFYLFFGFSKVRGGECLPKKKPILLIFSIV